MLRLAAAAALLVGVGLFLAYLAWVGKGPFASPAARHLRKMKDRRDVPREVIPYTFADFDSLPHALPLEDYAAIERRAVSLEGYVQFMFASTDGDFHVDVSETTSASGPLRTLPVTAEITPQWHRESQTWSWEPLAARFRSHTWTDPPWPGGPRRVRLSGWLLYDFEYDPPYRARPALTPGPRGRRRTGWEIHPVTRIELWDDSAAAFVDVPR